MARPRGDSAAALKVSKSHHRATDSGAKRKPSHEVREKRGARASASRSPEKEKRSHNRNSATSQTSSNVLSIDSLAKLNAENEKTGHGGHYEEKQKEKVATGRIAKDRGKHRKKKRVVSGAILEEGRGGRARGRRGGYVPTEGPRRKYGRRFWIMVGVIILLLIILIPVGVVLARKKSGSGGSGGSSGAAKPSNSELGSISQEDIPVSELSVWNWTVVTDDGLKAFGKGRYTRPLHVVRYKGFQCYIYGGAGGWTSGYGSEE